MDERGFPAALPVLADVKNRRQDAPGLRALPARGRLPRRGVQARAADRVEPGRGGAQQHARARARSPRSRSSSAPSRFVLISTDKAVNPKTVMGQSKALCEWIVEAFGHRDDVSTRFVAVRFGNVLGSSGSRDPDLPPPDREGRAADGHPPGDDALLHDDPRGCAARGPGRRDRRTRPGLRARHGRAGSILELARKMIRLSGKEPDETSRSRSSAPGRARSCTRSSGRRTTTSPRRAPGDHAARPSADRPAWLESELHELERLVEAGETLELVGRLAAIARAPHRLGVPEVGAAATATSVSKPA